MKSLLSIFVLAIVMTGLHAVPVFAEDQASEEDLSQANLESDFQAEDSRNLSADSALIKQEAKRTEAQVKSAQHKAEQLRIKNERTTAEIQGQSKRLEDAKQNLMSQKSKIDKLQIDLVNNSKELDRLKNEVTETRIKNAQARAEEIKVKRNLIKIEREHARVMASRAALSRHHETKQKHKAKKVATTRTSRKSPQI